MNRFRQYDCASQESLLKVSLKFTCRDGEPRLISCGAIIGPTPKRVNHQMLIPLLFARRSARKI